MQANMDQATVEKIIASGESQLSEMNKQLQEQASKLTDADWKVVDQILEQGRYTESQELLAGRVKLTMQTLTDDDLLAVARMLRAEADKNSMSELEASDFQGKGTLACGLTSLTIGKSPTYPFATIPLDKRIEILRRLNSGITELIRRQFTVFTNRVADILEAADIEKK